LEQQKLLSLSFYCSVGSRVTGRSNALEKTTPPILFRPDLDVPGCKKHKWKTLGLIWMLMFVLMFVFMSMSIIKLCKPYITLM